MKKQNIFIIGLILLAVISFIIFILVSGSGNKGNGNKGSGNKGNGNKGNVETPIDVNDIINTINKNNKNVLPELETLKVDIKNIDEVTSYTGLKTNDGIESIVVSEPLITSQAYSVAIVKVKDNADVEKIKQEMLDNIDMRRWICVSAEQLYITNSGNVIFSVMADKDIAKAVYNDFKKYVNNNIGKELEKSENSLTKYRVENQVINYAEETRSVAALNRDYELQYWESLNTYMVADSLIHELEKRMKLNTEIIQNNNSFILYNNKISEINEKLAVARYYSQIVLPQQTIDSLNRELEANKKALSESLQKMGYLKHSKEGIANSSIIEEWLTQILAFKKAEAELKVLSKRKVEMDKKYVHFAPIGSTLTRKERNVNINERRYMAILDALNAAILRQKNLQMTSSTLKPMNDPYYPLKPTIHPRKKLIIGAYLATLLFTIFFFLIIEVLDRTLRYVFKAEQITGSRVLGVFTRPLNLRARRFNQTYTEMSARTLCNYAITYFKPNQNNIINLISNQSGEGKNYVMQQLAKQFTAQGMEVTQLSWHEEHQADAQSFIQVLDIEKLEGTTSSRQKDNVFLVEYPSLKDAALTSNILQGANLNLQIIDSRRTWKNTDQQLFERTREMCGNTPFFIVLNYTNRDAAEEINGLMPPYTFFRKLFYRISQLGLTAKEQHLNV